MTSRSDPEAADRTMHSNESGSTSSGRPKQKSKTEARDVLQIPTRVMSKSEVATFSRAVTGHLLSIHSALETIVIVKQLELLVKEILKDDPETKTNDLKNRAILAMDDKKCEVMGAEVATKRVTEYEYDHASLLAALDAEKIAKENVKNIKTQLELGKEKGWVDPASGEIGYAKLIRDGVQISVSFKK